MGETMVTLRDIGTLSQDDLSTIANVINVFGNGQHPYADSRTITMFSAEYAEECLILMRDSETSTEKGRDLANLTLAKFKGE